MSADCTFNPPGPSFILCHHCLNTTFFTPYSAIARQGVYCITCLKTHLRNLSKSPQDLSHDLSTCPACCENRIWLMWRCWSCDFVNPWDSRFCESCLYGKDTASEAIWRGFWVGDGVMRETWDWEDMARVTKEWAVRKREWNLNGNGKVREIGGVHRSGLLKDVEEPTG